jgi:putative oxidoreductase
MDTDTALKTYLPLVGRVLLSILFFVAAYQKIVGLDETVETLRALNLPFPAFAAGVAISVEIFGGLMLFFGWYTRVGALMLVMFTLAASFMFHFDFSVPGQAITFLKNFAIIGGLLYVIAYGSGLFSLDTGRETAPVLSQNPAANGKNKKKNKKQ